MHDNIIRTETDRQSVSSPWSRDQNTQLVFFDGQTPDEETALNQGIQRQTLATLEDVCAVAAESGIEDQDLLRTTVYLTDMNDSDAVERAYDEFFENKRPALTLVGVEALPNSAAVQIEATGVDR